MWNLPNYPRAGGSMSNFLPNTRVREGALVQTFLLRGLAKIATPFSVSRVCRTANSAP